VPQTYLHTILSNKLQTLFVKSNYPNGISDIAEKAVVLLIDRGLHEVNSSFDYVYIDINQSQYM